MDKLNVKLAKWAGFRYEDVDPQDGGDIITVCIYPSGERKLSDPNFPNDLNVCFKWLVPKAIDKIMAEQECRSDLAYAILFKKWLQELELDIPRHAPTLCRAIEKLIGATDE